MSTAKHLGLVACYEAEILRLPPQDDSRVHSLWRTLAIRSNEVLR